LEKIGFYGHVCRICGGDTFGYSHARGAPQARLGGGRGTGPALPEVGRSARRARRRA